MKPMKDTSEHTKLCAGSRHLPLSVRKQLRKNCFKLFDHILSNVHSQYRIRENLSVKKVMLPAVKFYYNS